ncbi:hypothetical protein MXD81_49765 [Microbacteriaceae bacterium K1510]|nr:hypothetical protein [Microbacterium sp. 4NA327F11]MCK9917256.1 hypothetical protein [Microbacteriaceae bacterium K1510]|tara:strand:- start:239 stop:382 length:144 start_codon:yes stop_codon:yes gene_type:complete
MTGWWVLLAVCGSFIVGYMTANWRWTVAISRLMKILDAKAPKDDPDE